MYLNSQPVWQLYFKYKESLWFVIDWPRSASHAAIASPTLLPFEAKSTSLDSTKHSTPDETGSPKVGDESITQTTADNEVPAGLPPLQPSPENVILAADAVGDWIELSLFPCELDTVSEPIYEYWRQAAKGELPVPLAAWLSTVAFHASRRNFMAMNHISPTFENITSRILKEKESVILLQRHTTACLTAWWSLYWRNYTDHYRRSADYFAGRRIERLHGSDIDKIHQAILQDARWKQEPADIIRPDMDSQPNMEIFDDDLTFDLMLSMRKLLASKGAIAGLEISQDNEHICESLLAPLRTFLRDNSEYAFIPFHLMYGLELLLTIYKAFLWQTGDIEKPNCRNLALEFAKEVRRSILEAGSALESSGNQEYTAKESSIRLKVQAAKLDKFSCEQRSDLYYQSPWTAGCHMVEILDSSIKV
ncbi:hypothetical protein TSTA_014590 [Talaromyces stipitatus ATCC 10500]|uniref:Uncharacterized protein n=1 Tax=Talaromyces stipitatus (strain ATCC 10500 / CBS 375.48 / QM 6759 / NRRL 1006) TaxID=441959 RepID=B8MGY6_TALSN|nr:uncharacterized protein TSTA_014590 [Talaromyces stipitatus ATCC 10500]EED16367.1 hypothetical protein TSTA_014590 [Talaromyces stipitatus ATCC 10500]